MALVTTDNLKAELETFEITCKDDSVLDKMVELCICNRIDTEQMLFEWLAYSTTKDGLELTLNNLEHFEHEFLNKKSKSKPSSWKDESYNRTRDIHSLEELIKAEEEEEDLLDSYSTPGKSSQKRVLSTPEHPQSKRTTALLTSPGLLLSPANFSPSVTPSQKYSQRSGKGEVVVSFGAVQGARWTGRKDPGAGVQVNLLEQPEESLRSGYKYMFQRLRDVRNVLSEKIEEMGEKLRSHFSIEEFSAVSLPAQDSITVLGQICCDGNGKLNAQSVLLEAGPEHGGQLVPVDLSELKQFSLFPGQVVLMEGMNTTGRKLVASKLYEGVPLPFYSTSAKMETNEVVEPLNILVACGPYTPSDSLTFDPLIDLINVIVRDRPDVCLLFGPFVDSKHEQIEKAKVTETFETIFYRCIDSIVDGTRSVGCHLVFVPAQRDIHHEFIYPQPPFILPNLIKDQAQAQRVTLAPDPCTLLIDGVTFGLTSSDILFHMGAEEISCGTSSDRFSRILNHMLTQRSYYPLYPPAEEVNMDYEKFQIHGQMLVTPDILVVPSELRYFVKDVAGCVCVNPGRLTKGQVGGTYGRLLIQRSAAPEDGKRESPCLTAQVVKI
ncbi:DNA polymerase alpha subunit B isoform X1 [Gambusia affinis]|uniref:DNA polymerase alpha subunit B isoform X1 n=1 Tax=Gambusia affinis TaxID=33528 RepID=UPI001CDD1B29|nr:DNA polymerase alpha subunit B isoform X1 [Gambusia affinis]